MEKATIIGIDLAKRVFQVHAASKDGRYCAGGARPEPDRVARSRRRWRPKRSPVAGFLLE